MPTTLTIGQVIITDADDNAVLQLNSPGVIQFIAGDGSIAAELTAADVVSLKDRLDGLERSLQALKDAQIPVGTIVMSTLSAAQFQSQFAGTSARWVICDGKGYPKTPWARLVESSDGNVPDLTGRYPRGYKEGLPAAGSHQADAIAEHKHYLDGGVSDIKDWGIMNDAEGGGNNQVIRWANNPGPFATTGVVGAAVESETRPKTTVVNFFIRIQ
jgi:hypothetical protein